VSSPFQLLPPLTDEERAALKADIAARGVMVAIELDENGNILDGHHRKAIAEELGIEFPSVVRTGMDEAAKREHVLKINLLRRQLGPIAWADTFRKLAAERGLGLRQGARNDRTSAALSEVGPGSWREPKARTTLNGLAAELGVTTRTARNRVRLARELAEHPDLADQVDRGELAAQRAERIVRDRKAAARRDGGSPEPKRAIGDWSHFQADSKTAADFVRLLNVMDRVAELADEQDVMAKAVPNRRRATTAKRLRKLGMVLGGIARRLEPIEVAS
jgi:hypothetical protein